jgi:spoIIIJ-associated protein
MSSKIVEIEEKTIDGAIEKACRDFGVAREKLNIEIISEGSNGFLGFGAKKAKIRASLLSFDVDFPFEDIKPAVGGENRRESRPETKPEEKPNTKQQKGNKIEQKPANHRQEPPFARPAAADTPPVHAPSDVSPAAFREPLTHATPSVVPLAASGPSALKARQLLADILSMMTFECEVTAAETDDTIILNINIQGDKSALLIGRRGQNLDALQYLLNKAVNRADTERKMVVVDSEEYRKRREESLLKMAERIRTKVKKTQKPMSLSHMNARDRRIIHMALQEDETLVTKSRGEGEYRKVIVVPVRKNTGRHPKAKNGQ